MTPSLSVRLRPLLRRMYWALTPAVHGRGRPAHLADRSAAVPFGFDVAPSTPARPSVCVVCHLFYDDLAAEMREVLAALPFAFDLFVSTDDAAKRERIAAAFDGMAGVRVEVRIAPNRGRDIAPKLVTFADVYRHHEYVLFLHGKKSAGSTVGKQWRDTLIDTLAGSPDTVRSIMLLFDRYPHIGIVMAQHYEGIRAHLHWDHTFARARRLARRMGFALTPRHILDLPSGSMFWARTRALAPLLELGLRYEDFPVEKGQMRMTLHHAIERLFLFACEQAGMRWIKVADPRRYSERTVIDPIGDLAALDAFVVGNRLNLVTSDRL